MNTTAKFTPEKLTALQEILANHPGIQARAAGELIGMPGPATSEALRELMESGKAFLNLHDGIYKWFANETAHMKNGETGRVYEFLKDTPGATSHQVAAFLDTPSSTAGLRLARLIKAGLVVLIAKGKGAQNRLYFRTEDAPPPPLDESEALTKRIMNAVTTTPGATAMEIAARIGAPQAAIQSRLVELTKNHRVEMQRPTPSATATFHPLRKGARVVRLTDSKRWEPTGRRTIPGGGLSSLAPAFHAGI